jgi:hypothetical protein
MIKYLQEIWHDLTYREPTPQQRRNARAMRKWWRSFKKRGGINIPFHSWNNNLRICWLSCNNTLKCGLRDSPLLKNPNIRKLLCK